jgi:hypothetical protein
LTAKKHQTRQLVYKTAFLTINLSSQTSKTIVLSREKLSSSTSKTIILSPKIVIPSNNANVILSVSEGSYTNTHAGFFIPLDFISG